MDVRHALGICRSIRSYRPDPIPEPVLRSVLEQLRVAPSASNLQPWQFIVVRDPGTRRQLGAAARSQFFIAEAPVIIVGCGYPERAQDFLGGLGNSLPIDLAVAFDRMVLAAVSVGLATCWIGSYDEREVQEILEIPKSVRVLGMTPLGYPSDESLFHLPDADDRRPFEEVIVFDKYPRDTC